MPNKSSFTATELNVSGDTVSISVNVVSFEFNWISLMAVSGLKIMAIMNANHAMVTVIRIVPPVSVAATLGVDLVRNLML